MNYELKDEWKRFFTHWIAASFGYFLRSLFPVVQSWSDSNVPIDFPRWWAALFFAFLISLIAGGINSNLPCMPREVIKSMSLGFGINSAIVLANIQ